MTDRAVFRDYRVALVMSHAGMNAEQVIEIKRRLREIARAGGADPDGLALTVPVTRAEALTRDAAYAELLVEPLTQVMSWLRITILQVGPVEDVLECVKDHDEIWCVTARNQSEQLVRPARLYQLAQLDPKTAGRFKVIHFWVEPVPEAVKPKPKRPLRGW